MKIVTIRPLKAQFKSLVAQQQQQCAHRVVDTIKRIQIPKVHRRRRRRTGTLHDREMESYAMGVGRAPGRARELRRPADCVRGSHFDV